MKWIIVTIFALSVFFIKESYAPCRDIKVPTRWKTYSASEKRNYKQIGEHLYNIWMKNRVRGKRSLKELQLDDDVAHDRVKRNSYPLPWWPRPRPRPRPRRVEYRQMTVTEMATFHRCINLLKQSGQYDRFASQHQFSASPAAHLGTGFLPWHRQYMYNVEQAMRRFPGCGDVFIPYWDCPLDQGLPDPQDSVVWTKPFWGTTRGAVTSGSFGVNWGVIDECREIAPRLTRQLNTTFLSVCDRTEIISTFAAKSFAELNRFTDGVNVSQFEINHGAIHCAGGNCVMGRSPGCVGHLGCVDCSPADPLFYLLHSFVDCLWYEWAAIRGKDNRYPTSNIPGGQSHGPTAPMRPFQGLQNRDGMSSSAFTRCLPRPSRAGFTCHSDRDCRSPQRLLWCTSNRDSGRRRGRGRGRSSGSGQTSGDCSCRSKVKEGGNCRGLPDRSCYCGRGKGKCVNSKCQCRGH